MFPWQSGSEGIEETQLVHLNPVSDRWEPDLSRNQRHVNGAIFYNKYPDAAQGGLRNNAYTNVMVAWLCDVAGQLLALLPASRAEALRERLSIGDDELAVWQDMSRRMFVPFLGDGIISQFEGYEDLEELDWDAYRAKDGNIQLYFDPRLPSRLDGLSFSGQFRDTPIEVTLSRDRLTLAVHPEGASRPIRVAIPGEVRELRPGEQTVFELGRNPAATVPAARD